jgi:hypothetical protein
MTDTATAAAETPVSPTVDTTSPPHPAPQETPANDATPGTVESNAQDGSGAGDPAATPDGDKGDAQERREEKRKQTAQERIDEINAKFRTAERRAIAAEARAQALEKRLTPPGQHASLEEQDEFRVTKAVTQARAAELRDEAKEARDEAGLAMFQKFEAKAAAVSDRMPGLVEKFCEVDGVNDTIASFVADSDKGAEVAWHLTQNPHEAKRIASLSPAHQGIELARLEGKLSVAPQVRKVSTAPSPPPTVTGNPSPATRNPEEMSQSEYNAWYAKREAAKRKR